MDLHKKQFKIDYQGRPLVLEVSELAGQTNAAVIGRYGDTAVLVTVVMGKEDRALDYFPLIVDYEERFYAAGKILGSRFIRREGRPSEEAILSGRLVDRTIRPLFDHRMRRDVQVVVTILELDDENDPDFITLLTASTALAISDIPWGGPVAGVKLLGNPASLEINPVNLKIKESWPKDGAFQAFVAGTKERINMIELEGIDAGENAITDAFAEAQKEITKLTEWQEKIVKEIGKAKTAVRLDEPEESLVKVVKEFLGEKLEKALYAREKRERESKMAELRELLKGHLAERNYDAKAMDAVGHLFDAETDAALHRRILKSDERPDGRKPDEIRPLHAEASVLKRTHGSAIFIRGTTQALAVTTLAPPGTEQLIETIEFSGKRRFLLHYNFPPYSTGEVGRMGAVGRREIGHGALAEKAVRNLIPPLDEFPYTIRVVSEILSSNGSSSMATVCAASLSLMDAGVPIKKPVAGIAMGLIIEGKEGKGGKEGQYKVLTDIQGPEDHYGDMDCKVAGTADGIRAIQMDVKIKGLTGQMLADTLVQAKKARLEILKMMHKTIEKPRKELSPFAPTVLTISIDPSRIGELIGPGGKVINAIIERTGADIDVEETGKVFIAGCPKEKAEAAYKEVAGMFKEYKVGDIVEGPIVKILEFGAIVQIGPNRDGMIHVSELKNGYVKKVEDVVKLGDFVRVKVIGAEPEGKIRLSLKAL